MVPTSGTIDTPIYTLRFYPSASQNILLFNTGPPFFYGKAYVLESCLNIPIKEFMLKNNCYSSLGHMI